MRATVVATPYPLPFTIGSRRLLAVEREVAPIAFTLEDILSGRLPGVPAIGHGEGYRVLSAPAHAEKRLREAMPGFLIGAREDYERSYIAMSGSYDDYLARFSGKTRSTLRRKRRKVEQAGGGDLDMRTYLTPAEMDQFLQLAIPLSRRTYQARLLDAGLPDDKDARAEMRELAADDRVRAYILFLDQRPIAYLYLPVAGHTLVYAHLGYEPDYAELSPGTVLQMAALERLFAEDQFQFFDFTEGDGAHKKLFRTGSVPCASFLMLRPSWANRALLNAHGLFEAGVAGAKQLAERSGFAATLRKRLR